MLNNSLLNVDLIVDIYKVYFKSVFLSLLF